MKMGDDDPKTAGKALAALPGNNNPPAYDIGYRKPPARTRFKPGQSGNPGGRPKGAKNKPANPSNERFREIILEEAYRGVTINDGNSQITVPMAQAVVRSLAVNAAKGNARAQRLFAEMLAGTEATNKRLQDQLFEAAIDYKLKWERELERRRHFELDLPPPIPHPDHVMVDVRTGIVRFTGPMTKEELADHRSWLELKPSHQAELKFLERQLKKATNPSTRARIEAEIRQAKLILDALDKIEENLKVFG